MIIYLYYLTCKIIFINNNLLIFEKNYLLQHKYNKYVNIKNALKFYFPFHKTIAIQY